MSTAKKIIPLETWSPGQPWQPVHTPSRFRNALSKYRVWRSESKCIKCGHCVQICPYGVHTKAGSFLRRPKSHLCLGLSCQDKPFYCVTQCPAQALVAVVKDVIFQAFRVNNAGMFQHDALFRRYRSPAAAQPGKLPRRLAQSCQQAFPDLPSFQVLFY